MAVVKNEFSWSVARRNTFEECKRKYYLGYYAHWGGWESGADKLTREVYVLKQLKNRYMWVGSAVHDAIENTLRNLREGNRLPLDLVVSNVSRKIMEDRRDSKQGKYWVNPKKYCGLIEDEYYDGISESELACIVEDVERYLKNFYESKYFEVAEDLDENQWLPIEQFANFMLNDTKVYTKVDFAFRPKPHEATIVDWKTGGDERIDDDLQLTCYAMYASKKWGVPIDSITSIYFFLASNREQMARIDAGTIESTREIIVESILEMKEMLDDAENNIADEGRFPPTKDKKVCGFCNYKRVCMT